jgi:hypothetical protein
LDLVRGGIADYATAVASYNAAAPNDLGCVVEDRSAHLEADLGILVDVGRGAARVRGQRRTPVMAHAVLLGGRRELLERR